MNAAIVSFFFRVLNFGIIVGIVVYVYQRFGKEALQSMLREREEHKEALREEAKKLGARVKELEIARGAQQELCVTLTKNIDLWGLAVARDYAARQEEKMHIEQALYEKMAHLKSSLAWLEVRKTCVHGALQDATAELTAFYASPEAARPYLQKVLSIMQQEERS